MEYINQQIRKLIGIIPEDIPVKGLSWLLFPGKHSPMLSIRRAELIISRVRGIAALFAILTLAWIPVDFLFFPGLTAIKLASARVVAAAAFSALALCLNGIHTIKRAYLALALMFAIPTIFYIFSMHLLLGMSDNTFAQAMLSVYASLPIAAIAGISIFPLTILEALLFATPVILIESVAAYLNIHLFNISTHAGTLWMLFIVAMVASIAGISQLAFMASLMGQVMRDHLTKSFSRLSTEELLDLQFIIATRNQAPLSLAFIDLDNFKSVNDNFGHEMGDEVLINAAQAIRKELRNGDMLGRWGGEEFVLILPNTSAEQALHAIKRMCRHGLGTRPDKQPLTASIGIAERIADNTEDWKTLVEQADKRMYQAKQQGKNRIIHHSSKH